MVGGRAGEDASGGCVDGGKWPPAGVGGKLLRRGLVDVPRRCGGVTKPILGVGGVYSVCRGPRRGGVGDAERGSGVSGSGLRRGVCGSEWRGGVGGS